MHRAGWALVAFTLGAQDAYFQEPARTPWKPTWEWEFRSDRIALGPTREPIERLQSRLRLRWDLGEESAPWSLRLQSSHRVASDGNRNSLARLDNELANGTNLDLAELRFGTLKGQGGVELKAGLLENGLLTTEALWDPDLRLIGGGGRAFWRSSEGVVEELGLRVQAGQVRLPDGGRVRLQAGQVVFRAALEPFELRAFAGTWALEARQEDAAKFRRQNPAGPGGVYLDPKFRLDSIGIGLAATEVIPLEILATRQAHARTGEHGAEFQAWLGPRRQIWRPRFGYIRQRLDPTGALASLNGDLWWLHASGDGQRYVATLPLPRKWVVSLSYVEQTRRGGAPTFCRTLLELRKAF